MNERDTLPEGTLFLAWQEPEPNPQILKNGTGSKFYVYGYLIVCLIRPVTSLRP
jgi:hypothetical protein